MPCRPAPTASSSSTISCKPLTDQLLAAIRKIDDRPVRFVINTHYHGDHVGGNETLGKAGSVIIAHDNIRRRMSTDQFNQFLQ